MSNWRGFTLIELMVTVAILAIVAAIAIPAYNNQVQKARRADAVSELMETAQLLERCFTRNNTYAGCLASTSFESEDGHYDVTVVIPDSGQEYDITAKGKGSQKDDPCNNFNIDERGNKTAGSTTDRCWGS